MAKPKRGEVAQGTIYGFIAYIIWGVVPIYWPKLQPAGPLEILSHRVVWSLVALAIFLWFKKKWSHVIEVLKDRRKVWLLTLASVLIAVNWGLFIWASVSDRILDSSLGYYINPLFSIGLGVIFLKEKLRNLQWLAIAIAVVSVIYLTVTLGSPPYVALALASTFSVYGYVKKLANVEAIESLTIETIILAPVALGYLYFLFTQGQNTFGAHGLTHAAWLSSAGIITAFPLALFGAAAIRIPLSTLGFIQYIGPTIQFFIGLYMFNEPMPHDRFIGFVLTWIAIGIISFDALRNRTKVTKEYVPDLD
jgi:chloramphenicol-sensitive protein RarD